MIILTKDGKYGLANKKRLELGKALGDTNIGKIKCKNVLPPLPTSKFHLCADGNVYECFKDGSANLTNFKL